MTRAGNVLTPLVGALGAAALLAAGCSSDEAAPATTVVETTVGSTTSPTPSTDPPTTEPPVTDATTTTLDPAATLAAEVEADFLEADRLGREASMDPFDEEKEAAALDRRLGVIRSDLESLLADYRAKNYALRENPSVPPAVTVVGPAVLVADNSDLARLDICEINSWILVEVGSGPNGTDAIVDPTVVASRATVFLRLVDGSWKIEGGDQTGRWEGASKCPD